MTMTSLSVHGFHLVAFLCQRAGSAEKCQTAVLDAGAWYFPLLPHLPSRHRHAVQPDDRHAASQAVDTAGPAHRGSDLSIHDARQEEGLDADASVVEAAEEVDHPVTHLGLVGDLLGRKDGMKRVPHQNRVPSESVCHSSCMTKLSKTV